ncbi:MAG TPA: 4Fe-4S dicluster domain-containing protein, partial [Anaerolineales bacterium]
KRTYGPELMDAMRMLKRAADPKNILNPGKIIEAPKMDANLRYGEAHRAYPWQSRLSFTRNGGLDVAIEQCNGQGLCRKDAGVMCPSYQATRAEMHSTRGRANLLRAMISGPGRAEPGTATVPGLGSYDPEKVEAAAQALDLCLACKGCKAECPSGVDMAKLKFAFQSEYYKTHRRQWRDYVFGYFHITAKLAASVAPLSNALMEVALIKNIVAKVLGVTPHRSFPKFTGRRSKWLTTHLSDLPSKSRAVPGETVRHGEKVIFLSDVFARYVEPDTEQAALDILSACGFDIYVLPILGAGASFLSKGFIEQARDHAARMLGLLNQADPAGKAHIVGIEPPEIYTFKHDYIDLLPGRVEEIYKRTANVWLLDEYLLRSDTFHDLRVVNRGSVIGSEANLPAKKVFFHPHCHQRAEGLSPDGLPSGTSATLKLLRFCGYDVELMDTGCCGMAGTFGYEAEHYELSMKIGGLQLFPQIRELKTQMDELKPGPPEVVSSGAACRLQIKQGTGVEAIHPIRLVAEQVKKWKRHGTR